ncbi:chorismate mutase [Calidifontibacillus oryziterrae]|uniref:chorismate mutase n=1 Tax=Calidifontibacillus oryziterrae TaxID=1191699 RepID=UPI0002EE7ABC|nr:chorismate mutase [Calidifontibacillus oryziterrae]
MIRGVRGATTVKHNNAEEMVDTTKELIAEMINKNNVRPEDVAQVLISVTEDLDATFPAKALRLITGWAYVPVMCMREIPVPNSLAKCIRIMMTVETSLAQDQVQHVYLHGAEVLRPDLKNKG